MPRDYRLVLYLGEWQVCSKARRLVDGEILIQWIFGEQRIVLCDVGQEQDVMELPKPGGRNFFGDHFIHALDIQRPHEPKPSKVGGVNDPGAAQAAYRHLLKVTEPTAQVTLREGGRIIAQGMGQAVWSDLIDRWVPRDFVDKAEQDTFAILTDAGTGRVKPTRQGW